MLKLTHWILFLGIIFLSFSSQAMRTVEDDETSQSLRQSSSSTNQAEETFEETSYMSIIARKAQNSLYQLLAATVWDPIMAGFKPARIQCMELLELKPQDKILLIGEGTGLDFEVLPETVIKENVWALDYSSEMVKKAKERARILEIPDSQCLLGDAQNLPFDEKFDKILFPLSLGSIPNPTLAFKEAERVLAPHGKIALFEKLVDDRDSISYTRRVVNFFTRFIFADINRNLTQMLGSDTTLKIIYYESLGGKLSGYVTGAVSSYYRVAVLVRQADYPNVEAIEAIIK